MRFIMLRSCRGRVSFPRYRMWYVVTNRRVKLYADCFGVTPIAVERGDEGKQLALADGHVVTVSLGRNDGSATVPAGRLRGPRRRGG